MIAFFSIGKLGIFYNIQIETYLTVKKLTLSYIRFTIVYIVALTY